MSPSLSHHKDDGLCIFFRAGRKKQEALTPNASQAEDKEQGQLSFVNTVTQNSEIKQKAANIKPTVDAMICSWETLWLWNSQTGNETSGKLHCTGSKVTKKKAALPVVKCNQTSESSNESETKKLQKHPSLSQHSFRKHCGLPRGKCAGKFPSMQCWKKPQTCLQRDS